MSVLVETSAGDLVIDLFVHDCPKACLNFIKLCKSKYYNFSPIYNIQTGAFFQTGDPLWPIGDGGSSIWGLQKPEKRFFKPEIKKELHHESGSISMACSSDGVCGSQFFVSIGDNEGFDGKHAIFGRLAEGFDTLEAIQKEPLDETGRPLRDIRITHTIILEDPFEDPSGYVEVPASPVPSAAQLSTVRIAFDEVLEETGTLDEIEARKRAREAEAQALTLEMVGDLPFATIRPPENILFVCKLNPVTSSEDLELIFGRFGQILSCEIVRDKRTGDSLQYAFIEFDIKEDAERAYFKMQGVLIDDRRIHVDFSQSVAKLPFGRDGVPQSGKSGGKRGNDRRRQGDSGAHHDGPYGRNEGYGMVFDHDDTRRHEPQRYRDERSGDRDRHRTRRRSRTRSTSRSDQRRYRSRSRSRHRSRREIDGHTRERDTHRRRH